MPSCPTCRAARRRCRPTSASCRYAGYSWSLARRGAQRPSTPRRPDPRHGTRGSEMCRCARLAIAARSFSIPNPNTGPVGRRRVRGRPGSRSGRTVPLESGFKAFAERSQLKRFEVPPSRTTVRFARDLDRRAVAQEGNHQICVGRRLGALSPRFVTPISKPLARPRWASQHKYPVERAFHGVCPKGLKNWRHA